MSSSLNVPHPVRALLALLTLTACGGDATNPQTGGDDLLVCSVDVAQFHDGGVGRDGIPSLSNPPFVAASSSDAIYVQANDRVIGLRFGDRTLAIPHNSLWWHEIMNLDLADAKIAVTYCPLTGTSMVFDREPVGGAELGVSGLLFQNNLVMYDRSGEETLFPQIMGEGVCGLRRQTTLPRVAITEMTWAAWTALYPETEVVSSSTGYGRDYTQYPYGNYEQLSVPPFLPTDYDRSRQPKERVVGIEGRDGGFLALPFLELEELGELGVVNVEVDGSPLTVVWSRAGQSGTAFSATPVGGTDGSQAPLTFQVTSGKLFDVETGSEWNLRGQAVSGPLQGASLELHPEAMVGFWFAWSVFHPTTEVWTQ